MVINFLRENKIASYLLLAARLYLGLEWLKSGWEKIHSQFESTGFLAEAIKSAGGDHPAVQDWWATFLKSFALPHADLFNFIIPWGEFFVGLGLIFGGLTAVAALMGIIMNFAYLLSGTTSTNPQMILITIFILVAGANAGRIGIDYALQKMRQRHHFKMFHHKKPAFKG